MGIGSSGVVNCANTYLGTANYTVADGYVADRTPIVGGNGPAQLNLNFARNEVLDPRITFSRTSNATRVNAQGLIEYAPHNLLTNSENFDNAAWAKSNATITANTVTAPDGTLTADILNDTSSVSAGYVYQSVNMVTGSVYAWSVYAKSNDRPDINFTSFTQAGSITFTLSGNGSYTTPTGVITSAVITNIGGGWYRCTAIITANATGNSNIGYSTNQSGYVGAAFALWGAQLNIGSLQPYYTTSVKNFLGYSQNFENAAWTKSNSTIDATPVMGPLGFLGAEKLVESAVNNTHAIAQNLTYSTQPYTLSVYAKAGERSWIMLNIWDGTTSWNRYFNLLTGTIGSGSSPSHSISSIGSGWYRCSITVTTAIGAGQNSSFYVAQSNNVLSYTGDGTSGIYIFGAQLSDSASLDPYVYNFEAAPTSSAYYGPRFDYDPVTLAPKGLLIEEARTNLFLQSQFAGGWLTNGATTSFGTGTTSPDGTLTAIPIIDTSSSLGGYVYQNVSFTSGQSYCTSVYVKQGSCTLFYIQSFTQAGTVLFNLTTGIVSSLSGIASNPNIISVGSGWYRCSVVFTANATAGCNVGYGDYDSINTGTLFTLWGAQLEAGSFPTSYIPTTSASVTRAADNASMVGTNFSSWYNQSEGTVAAEFDSLSTLTAAQSVAINRYPSPWHIEAGTTDTNIIWYGSNAELYIGGSYNNIGNVPTASFNKFAVAISSTVGNSASSLNASNAITRNGIATGTATSLGLGSNPLNSAITCLNGHIQSFKYFSKRLLNSYLQSLTQ